MLFDDIAEKSFIDLEQECEEEDNENATLAEVSLNALVDNMSRKTIILGGDDW